MAERTPQDDTRAYLTCEGSDDPSKRCGRHHPTELASFLGGYECCCGEPWSGKESKCLSGAKTGDHVASTTFVAAEGLRDRLAEAVAGAVPDGAMLTERDIVDAVMAALAVYPGDLPARMAEAIAAEWSKTAIVCEHTQVIGFGALAAAAMYVRWEDHAQTVAENAELRRKEEHAVKEHQVTRERLAATRRTMHDLAENIKADAIARKTEVAALREELAEAQAERDNLRARLTGVSVHASRLTTRIAPGTETWTVLTDLLAAVGVLPARPDVPEEIQRLAQATESTEETTTDAS